MYWNAAIAMIIGKIVAFNALLEILKNLKYLFPPPKKLKNITLNPK